MTKKNNNRKKVFPRPNPMRQLQLETVRTKGSLNPPEILTSIPMSYRLGMLVQTTGALVSTVNFSDLILRVPGGPTAWTRMRINHVEAWGPDNASANTTSSLALTVTLPTESSAAIGGDVPSFTDHGTYGANRAHVSFRPGLFQRAQWQSSGIGQPAVTIRLNEPVATTSHFVVLQVSVDLRSVEVSNPQ
jgi:hypothetical protein